jgi:acetyltransferase-like isoleucine patch superfamily enzyme
MKRYFEGVLSLFIRVISYFPSHLVRVGIYKLIGAKFGAGSTIYSLSEIRKPWAFSIGLNSIIGEKCMIDARRGVEIGDNVNLSSFVTIWTLHHDYNDKYFKAIGGKVIINNYCWVCSNVIILPGVEIGKGAVVAAGSVVTRDVEPFVVVGGVPAKKIADRDPNLKYTLKYIVPFI